MPTGTRRGGMELKTVVRTTIVTGTSIGHGIRCMEQRVRKLKRYNGIGESDQIEF